jgi:hypothetical protein
MLELAVNGKSVQARPELSYGRGATSLARLAAPVLFLSLVGCAESSTGPVSTTPAATPGPAASAASVRLSTH